MKHRRPTNEHSSPVTAVVVALASCMLCSTVMAASDVGPDCITPSDAVCTANRRVCDSVVESIASFASQESSSDEVGSNQTEPVVVIAAAETESKDTFRKLTPLEVESLNDRLNPQPRPRKVAKTADKAAPHQAHTKKRESPELQTLRQRLIEVERRHQDDMASFARALTSENQRAGGSFVQLAAAKSDGGEIAPCLEGASLRQAAQLEAQLERERQRNAELTAKLKLASRAAELVFRMRQQAIEETFFAQHPRPQTAPAIAPAASAAADVK